MTLQRVWVRPVLPWLIDGDLSWLTLVTRVRIVCARVQMVVRLSRFLRPYVWSVFPNAEVDYPAGEAENPHKNVIMRVLGDVERPLSWS